MTIEHKTLFGLCLTVSLLIHAAVSFFVDPVIDGKGNPVMYSWLDLLSPLDISRPVSSSFQEELYFPFDARTYVLASLMPERLRLCAGKRNVFPGMVISDFKKARQKSVNFKRDIVASLEAYEPKTKMIEYKSAVTPKGRLLFAAPSMLAFDSPLPFAVEEKLRHDLIFLGKGSFYWTSISVMIE